MKNKYSYSSFHFIPTLVLIASAAILSSCQKSANIEVKPQGPLQFSVIRTTTLSTYDKKDEVSGTEVQTLYTEKWTPTPEGYIIDRKYEGNNSKGYHRKSLPYEMSLRMDLKTEIRQNRIWAVSGFDQFVPKVVEPLQVIKRFRDELKNELYPAVFARLYRNDFDMAYFAKGDLPKDQNITNLVLTPQLTNVIIDSVRTEAFETIEDEPCLKIKTFYRTVVPSWGYLMLEQTRAASKTAQAELKDYFWESGKVEGELMVWRSVNDGVVRRSTDFQKQTHIAKHKTTHIAQSFRTNFGTETLYKKPDLE